MTLELGAFPVRRLVLVRFVRGVPPGDPSGDAPDIDERGHLAPFPGPATSVAAGRTVRVGLQRFFIEARTPLFVESSDPAVVRVADPADGRLPPQAETTIGFTGVDGGTDHREAKLRVRMGAADGAVIHELHVVVFRPVSVRMTPHVITINSGSTAGKRPLADVAAIMTKVNEIWAPAGVSITAQPTLEKTVTFKNADMVANYPFPGEVATLLADKWPDGTVNWIPNTVNVYFVVQLATVTLGIGLPRSGIKSWNVPNPGIILADRTALGPRTGILNFAQTLAHEFGHFFTLLHPGGGETPDEREDTWCRRMLMHNFNPMRSRDPFPVNDVVSGRPFKERPRFNDIGYGFLEPGCLLTIKDVAGFSGDAQCFTARTAITTPPGPF